MWCENIDPRLNEHQPEQEEFCTFVSARCFRTFFVSSVQMGWFIYTFRKKSYNGDIQLNIANTEFNIRLIFTIWAVRSLFPLKNGVTLVSLILVIWNSGSGFYNYGIPDPNPNVLVGSSSNIQIQNCSKSLLLPIKIH